jgi:hypothetical protein
MQRTILVVTALLLAFLAPACPPSPLCQGKPFCVVLADADSDQEIADDLRNARNQLLYGPTRPTATDTVWLYAPPAGTYGWTGEVRFCGDATASPTGEDEPDCDGTDALPTIRFAGAWNAVTLAANCPDGDETPWLITACLHVGDRAEGDGGAAEPAVRVVTQQALHFRHVHTTPFPTQVDQFISAVWLDGIDASAVSVTVHGDVPPEEIGAAGSGSGSGVYASATDSALVVGVGTGTGANLLNGLVLDGRMDGSEVWLDSDFSASGVGPGAPSLSIGTGGIFFFGSGPRDGCDYGPDTAGTCANFTAHAAVKTPTGMIGSDGIMVYAADGVLLDVAMDYRTQDHIPIKVDCVLCLFGCGPGAPNCPGEVDDLTIEGDIVYDGVGVAVATSNGAQVTLDTDITLLDPSGDCYAAAAGANVVLGPSYACHPAGP